MPKSSEREFICPLCLRTVDTDKLYADCRYCAEPMVEKREWDRHQKSKKKKGKK